MTKAERKRAAERGKPHSPGKMWRYAWGCHCDGCRAAWAEYRRPKVKAYRARKRREEAATHPVGCRCLTCKRYREGGDRVRGVRT